MIAVLALVAAAAVPSRTFRVEQTIDVPAQKEKIQLWVPLPHDDAWQKVTYLEAEGAETVRDALGNLAAKFTLPPDGAKLHVLYTVQRTERSGELTPLGDTSRWLQNDRLVVVDDTVRALSAEVMKGKTTNEEKARAAYEYTLANMKYQKTGDGWGNGSIIWACTAKYGNCTDFHSLFIGLMRAAGVPARFEIGRSIPSQSGQVAGYHCWADFDDGKGWVAVDASEAWKHPEKRDWFFGHHDPDRFALSMGRDLQFPGMSEKLNYFVDPYGQLGDGSKATGITQTTLITSL